MKVDSKNDNIKYEINILGLMIICFLVFVSLSIKNQIASTLWGYFIFDIIFICFILDVSKDSFVSLKRILCYLCGTGFVLFLNVIYLVFILLNKRENIEHIAIGYSIGVFQCLFMLIISILLLIKMGNIISKLSINSFFTSIKQHIGIICICCLFLFGCISQINSWMTNDSSIYYIGIYNARENWNFINMDALNLGAHGGYAYCLFALLGDLIGSATYGIVFVNIILAIYTILSLYNIFNILYNDANRIAINLLCLLFAVSPFVYGMIGDINLEFPQMCFLVWLISANLSKDKWLKIFCSFLLCFTKETAIMILGMYCFGEFIYHFINKKEENIFRRIVSIINDDMYFEFVCGLLGVYVIFFMNFKDNGMLNETINGIEETVNHSLNSFGLWSDYILYKLNEIFVFNWHWVVTLSALIILILNLKQLKKIFSFIIKKDCIGILFANIAFLFSQLFYITWTNYRYLIMFVVFETIFLSMTLLVVCRNQVFQILIPLSLSVLMFISNYYVCDPVSEKIFLSRNVGNGNMMILSYFTLDCLKEHDNQSIEIYRTANQEDAKLMGTRDCLLYNRQHFYLGEIWQNILQDIDLADDTLLIIPNILYNKENTARSVLDRDYYALNTLYWNDEKNNCNINFYRDEYFNYEERGYKKINIDICNQINSSALKYSKYKKIYCIYFNINKDYDLELFFNKKEKKLLNNYKANVYSVDLYEVEKK